MTADIDDIFGSLFEADREVPEAEKLPGIVLTTTVPLTSAEFDAKYLGKLAIIDQVEFEDEQGNAQ